MDVETKPHLPTQDPDAALIQAFWADDKTAFDQLVLLYQDRVFNLCYRLLGEREEANDCGQETFVKVYRSLRNFRFGSRFSTWLYTIAVNTCKNRIASAEYRYKKKTVSLDSGNRMSDENTSLEIEDPSPSPLAQLTKKEREVMIQRAIDALPHDFRTVITLRDIEGLSYEELADITGYNPGTVKSKLARARQQLRENLKGVI